MVWAALDGRLGDVCVTKVRDATLAWTTKAKTLSKKAKNETLGQPPSYTLNALIEGIVRRPHYCCLSLCWFGAGHNDIGQELSCSL